MLEGLLSVPRVQEAPIVPLPEGLLAGVARPSAPARLAGVRVLVVEDDDDSRDLMCALLENVGATALCVASVAKALDALDHTFDPDVVLTDFSMPNATGLDFIREFRKTPSTHSSAVPVLVVSGHNANDWREQALAAGAAYVLSKPFEPALLIARLAAAVASSRDECHGRTVSVEQSPRLKKRR
jgi:CheY-like chemotaxis protein